MNRFPKWIVLMIFVLALGACSTGMQDTTAAPEDIAQTPTQTEVPTAAVLTETPEIVSECVSCHTDKQRLIDTAKAEEEVETENEGAG